MKKLKESEYPIQQLLTEKQASHYLNMSLAFLRRRRSQGAFKGLISGPKFVKFGKSVRYRQDDLDAWVEKYLKEVV